ncbi:Hypothetical protein ORPV_721 [Orpheovirus IHUMI-LCC2]|uniref:Uncharacterized protein n=1 Tax=Orpheovirus IHUMI-LCC2 TaxID=2023057 RepID=A0A2I2L4Z3_9VIRU|nr:Hypothetical protein ORPV_721 [Orpheovirus IHUMI-LCC2]SNW62625.1 Hypothetical protein ORPV_721 [Orpheovirus IHUMI-LCC2]
MGYEQDNYRITFFIKYEEDNEETNVEVRAGNVWDYENNFDWNNDPLIFDIYNYDGLLDTSSVPFNDIVHYYPYLCVLNKYKLLKDSRDFKIYKDKMDRLMTNISLGLLGYKVEGPGLLLNRLLDGYKR